MSHPTYSILDLAPIVHGGTAADAFRNTLDLARHAEKWGFHRFWLAEHHNMPSVASSATSIVIGYVAGGTKTIRVGSGGIMLPNHAPLMIAEQFGTLESMYPGRIDLGLGRAPGTDQPAARALRRGLASSGQDFPELLHELRSYLSGSEDRPFGVRAVPGEGLNIPIWLLGSSDFSARLAAQLGLPFAFASHFAPDFLMQALDIYRTNFNPSGVLNQPRVMVALNVFAADTEAEARRLATSQQLQFLSLIRGQTGPLHPPVDDIEAIWNPHERAIVESQLRYSIIGDPQTVKQKLHQIQKETDADELIVSAQIYDHAARLRSIEIFAETAGIKKLN